MEVWIVFHSYNANTDNNIMGVFESKEMAFAYVEEHIESSTNTWREPYIFSSGEAEYNTENYEESFEITCHMVKVKEANQ
jgi:hypothetical protein